MRVIKYRPQPNLVGHDIRDSTVPPPPRSKSSPCGTASTPLSALSDAEQLHKVQGVQMNR
jgi:hypothetical protein